MTSMLRDSRSESREAKHEASSEAPAELWPRKVCDSQAPSHERPHSPTQIVSKVAQGLQPSMLASAILHALCTTGSHKAAHLDICGRPNRPAP